MKDWIKKQVHRFKLWMYDILDLDSVKDEVKVSRTRRRVSAKIDSIEAKSSNRFSTKRKKK